MPAVKMISKEPFAKSISQLENRMNGSIVRYRFLVTLVTIAISAVLIISNHYLPAAYQLFAWGVAIGLLSTFGYIAFTWFFDVSLLLLIPLIPIISSTLRFGFGFGLGYPKGNYYWIGEGIGLGIMITISLLLPLRTSAQPGRPQRRTMPPLEESSSHKLILPRTSEPRSDKPRSA
jgi:hypothetical protein